MWIEHIGEIAIGFVALLLLGHFGMHLVFKRQKKKQDKIQNGDS